MFTKTNEIRIETSTICNYRCQMCARDTFCRKQEVMSNSLFDNIIEKTRHELPHINAITFSGFGEFSADPNWRHKIITASKDFDRIHILTNMSLLNREDVLFLLNYISDIRISIYGCDQETYGKIHRPPPSIRYQAIEEAILFLIENINSHQQIILNYVEIKDNCHQTTEWISYWKNRVDIIEVWKPHNWIDGKCYRDLDAQRLPTCGRPFNGPIQVQVNGTVNVCCFDYNGEMIIGDLNLESFTKIFDSDYMKKVQNLHASGHADQLPQCKVCDQRNNYKSKITNLIHTSRLTIRERIHTTSTECDLLVGDRLRNLQI